MTVPKTSILKIDKDCLVDLDWNQNYVQLVVSACSKFGVSVRRVRMCKSKDKGVHYYVHISPPVQANLANQLQYLCGDDPCRVDHNRARIGAGLQEWNKLFEKPNTRLRTINKS
jgi:hypothetical protein